MKVTFGQISTGNTHFSIRETDWFPSEEFPLVALHHAEIDIVKKNSETVVLEGDLKVSVEFLCDRCGDAFVHSLSVEFLYLFKTCEDKALQLRDMEFSEDDCNTVYLDEPIIDVKEILREQVLLGIPEQRICNESCKGLCAGCGAVLSREQCKCGSGSTESPFSVLKKLKDF